MTHTQDWVIPHRKTAGAISVYSAGTTPWILDEGNEGFLFIRLQVSAPPRGKRQKSSDGDLAPSACQAQRKSRMPPLCSRKTCQARLPSDRSHSQTPSGPRSFLRVFWVFFFVPHCGLQNESYTQGSICLLQTSNILTALPGRIIHFSQSEQVCFQRKNISMATDPSHTIELLMQLS